MKFTVWRRCVIAPGGYDIHVFAVNAPSVADALRLFVPDWWVINKLPDGSAEAVRPADLKAPSGEVPDYFYAEVGVSSLLADLRDLTKSKRLLAGLRDLTKSKRPTRKRVADIELMDVAVQEGRKFQ